MCTLPEMSCAKCFVLVGVVHDCPSPLTLLVQRAAMLNLPGHALPCSNWLVTLWYPTNACSLCTQCMVHPIQLKSTTIYFTVVTGVWKVESGTFSLFAMLHGVDPKKMSSKRVGRLACLSIECHDCICCLTSHRCQV